ncbi:MAG TPA: helix-turn-helix domain-containing protein [Nakamurella sp.]
MPPTSPDRVVLTDTQRQDLDRLIRSGRTEQRLTLRAGIVLAAADGHPNARIAASMGVCQDTARKWRHRWCTAPGVSSLGDAKRSGRRPVFSAVSTAAGDGQCHRRSYGGQARPPHPSDLLPAAPGDICTHTRRPSPGAVTE